MGDKKQEDRSVHNYKERVQLAPARPNTMTTIMKLKYEHVSLLCVIAKKN
jgi:hypothetical protein